MAGPDSVPDDFAPKPSVPMVPLQYWEGSADPAYLLAELEELRRLAQEVGLGTLAYLLECAAIECRHQVESKRDGDERSQAG